jgi:hypothetical protein
VVQQNCANAHHLPAARDFARPSWSNPASTAGATRAGLLFSGRAGLIRDLKVLCESCKP